MEGSQCNSSEMRVIFCVVFWVISLSSGQQNGAIENKFDEVVGLGKDLALGAPSSVFLEGVNKLCSLALAKNSDLYRPSSVKPQAKNVSLLFDNRSYGLGSIREMLNSQSFKKNNPTVILTTGWMSMKSEDNPAADDITSAYKCRGGYNVLVSVILNCNIHSILQWFTLLQLFNSAHYIDTLSYVWAAKNTESLGNFLANFLVEMSKFMEMKNVHLVGHSLGAQINGAAGKYYYKMSGKLLPRITGLDPAMPCFNEGESLTGLRKGDAEFVDVIHTNSGALGQRNPVGHADFYPNGMVLLQPGTTNIGHSHMRAVDYYVESVLPGNENTFIATRCNSIDSLNRRMCTETQTPMGLAASKGNNGIFFLKTNSQSPYGIKGINKCNG